MPRARPNRAARIAAALTCAGIVLAAGAWFAHANGQEASGDNAAGWVLTGPATTAGSWHWLEQDGTVGAELDPESVIVPGDRVGFVPTDADTAGAERTTATFALPTGSGNDTQGRVFTVAADGSVYTLRPIDDDAISFQRNRLWVAFALGSAVAFVGCGTAAAVAARRRATADTAA